MNTTYLDGAAEYEVNERDLRADATHYSIRSKYGTTHYHFSSDDEATQYLSDLDEKTAALLKDGKVWDWKTETWQTLQALEDIHFPRT